MIPGHPDIIIVNVQDCVPEKRQNYYDALMAHINAEDVPSPISYATHQKMRSVAVYSDVMDEVEKDQIMMKVRRTLLEAGLDPQVFIHPAERLTRAYRAHRSGISQDSWDEWRYQNNRMHRDELAAYMWTRPGGWWTGA